MTNICRLCLSEITSRILIEDNVPDETKIKLVIPEIDPGMTSVLVLCNLCSRSLSVAYDFKRGCLKTEGSLKRFLKEHNLSVPFDLTTYRNSTSTERSNTEDETTTEVDGEVTGILYIDDIQEQYNIDIICEKCGGVFYDNESYDTHEKECFFNQSNENGKGDLCREEEQGHHEEHILAKPHKCQHCNKLFSAISDLNIHLSSEHPSFHQGKSAQVYKKSYSCPICGKKMTQKVTLMQHMKIQCNVKNVCKICGASIQGKLAFKEHMRIKHPKPYICEICGFATNRKFILNEHRRTHTGETPYWCEICGRGFKQRGHLKTHNQTVHATTPSPFMCETCGRMFRLKASLKKHMLVHRDANAEKTFYCDFENCGRRYYTARSRTKHMKFHGKKEVICHICGMAFVNKSGLDRHVVKHTREKPYKCDICHYSCNQPSNLKAHLKLHAAKIMKLNESSKKVNSDASQKL